AKDDEEKTAFIISQGIFCYTKMPFGLKNTEASYQHLVNKAFRKQIGRNLKVYMDDLVIKIRTEDKIVRYIEETFKILKEISMKLNPKKCTFGVEERMFLGYKVNTMGLKVCPDKKSDFQWTVEAEEAFKKIKQLIAELPMLAVPMEKEELIVYLAAAKEMENILETACNFLTPGLLIIPLYGDGDLTTMKFIQAEVECSSSLIFTSSCICPIGHIILPLNPIKGVLAGTNWFLISERS
nr:reverse transcriptase domain-containing protein [Tanacetum cinerariifolium]